jgi:hypothetical protein
MIVAPCGASEPSFRPAFGSIQGVRINLSPHGAQIGWENEVAGDHPAVSELVDLIDHAAPGNDHKCPNIGAIRLFREDRSVVAVGLLPSHSEGRFDLRLYDDGRFECVVQVDHDRLREILASLGVPEDEPIMR